MPLAALRGAAKDFDAPLLKLVSIPVLLPNSPIVQSED
jgi:hypothetical protein